MEDGEKTPEAAIYVVDSSFKVVNSIKADARGEVAVPEKDISDGRLIAIGSKIDGLKRIDRKSYAVYKGSQIREIIDRTGSIRLERRDWRPWLQVELHVSGEVKRCYPWPQLYTQLQQEMLTFNHPGLENAVMPQVLQNKFPYQLAEHIPSLPHRRSILRCEDVCDGIVEVYRRNSVVIHGSC